MRKKILWGLLLGVLVFVSACARQDIPTYLGDFECDYFSSLEVSLNLKFLDERGSFVKFGGEGRPRWTLDILSSSVVKVGFDFGDDADWAGTGFLILGDKAVTVAHVVDLFNDAESVEYVEEHYKSLLFLQNYEGEQSLVSSLLWDKGRDAAILSVSNPKIGVPLTTGNPYNLSFADVIYTIGYASGNISIGKGSFFGVFCPEDSSIPLLVASAYSFPGNSGGPALNASGQVIGIIVSGEHFSDLSWTAMVPINYALELIEPLDEETAPVENWQGKRG